MNEQSSNVAGGNKLNQEKKKKPVPKIAIIASLAGALLLFVLTGAYFVLVSVFKPERVVSAFSESVETENYDKLERVLKTRTKEDSFSKSDLKRLR